MQNEYILLSDQISCFRNKKDKQVMYGRKGEKVKEISDCNNVMVVEGKNGDRFPVEKIFLQSIKSNK